MGWGAGGLVGWWAGGQSASPLAHSPADKEFSEFGVLRTDLVEAHIGDELLETFVWHGSRTGAGLRLGRKIGGDFLRHLPSRGPLDAALERDRKAHVLDRL